MTRLISYFRLAKTLVPPEERRANVKRIKMSLRLYFFYHQQATQIEEFFNRSDLRRRIIATQGMRAQIYKQQIRPSFFKRSSNVVRWNFLTDHFSFLEKSHNTTTIENFYTSSIAPITYYENEQKLSIRISYHPDTMREGFLWLLLEMNDEILYKIIFWFSEYNGTPTLCIGALQGGKATLEMNRIFTKEFWGLRPQNMTISILRSYARTLGIQQIFAVSTEKLWSNKIKDPSALGEFWQEQGGEAVAEGNFIKISMSTPYKDAAQIPTRKRSMYKKRYEFLDKFIAICDEGFKAYKR